MNLPNMVDQSAGYFGMVEFGYIAILVAYLALSRQSGGFEDFSQHYNLRAYLHCKKIILMRTADPLMKILGGSVLKDRWDLFPNVLIWLIKLANLTISGPAQRIEDKW